MTDNDRGEPFDYEALSIMQNDLAHLVRAVEDSDYDIEHLIDIQVCTEQLAQIMDLARQAQKALDVHKRSLVIDNGGEVTFEDGSRFTTKKIYTWKFDHREVERVVVAQLDVEDKASARAGYEAALELYVSPSSRPKTKTLDSRYGTPPWEVGDRTTTEQVVYEPSEIAEALA